MIGLTGGGRLANEHTRAGVGANDCWEGVTGDLRLSIVVGVIPGTGDCHSNWDKFDIIGGSVVVGLDLLVFIRKLLVNLMCVSRELFIKGSRLG